LVWLLGSDGPGRLKELGWSDRVGLADAGLAQKKGKGLLFSEFILNVKTIPENLEIVLNLWSAPKRILKPFALKKHQDASA
jgi:hypothetical protein